MSKNIHWTSGYVSEIDYTYGYFPELNPLRVKQAFLNAGLMAPTIGTACELGFGQGMSTNLHAAATTISWYGTDFNPSQAGFAQSLANSSGANAKLFDESFDEFCSRSDLPSFDYIGLHGIWSWISDENRSIIVDFIKRKLKVGGVLYISYNTQPGWATFSPIRHLMTQYADLNNSTNTSLEGKVNSTLEFLDNLTATSPKYLKTSPSILERITGLKAQKREYLAHEYFNKDWHHFYFNQVESLLTAAKLTYACSANYLDHVDEINFTQEQQKFLSNVNDTSLKETVKDFIVNQQFRRDYWVKGARKISPSDLVDQLRGQKFVLTVARNEVRLEANGSLGKATFDESIYGPILDLLADNKPKTVFEIEKKLIENGIDLKKISQAMLILTSIGATSVAQEETEVIKARKVCEKINREIIKISRFNKETNCLASPVTGGGIGVGRFSQLFLLSQLNGRKTPREWAQDAWVILNSQGQRISKNGLTLATEAENLAELCEQAEAFEVTRMPILKALQITL